MTGNIIGEPFDKFVKNQINIRQSNQYSGYGGDLRTDDQLKYLNNRNAWVKLASSISILEDKGLKKLENIGIQTPNNFLGTILAEKAILFNTLSSFDPTKKEYSLPRAGIANNNDLWNDQFIYGIGGTNFGLQPPPGIISATVDSLNRGSIRKANVTLKAHNKFQFDIIELLYLRLGSTMMLEWGWDKYLDSSTGKVEQMRNTIIEEEWFTSNGISQRGMLNKIQIKRRDYDGNYDGFFGKVSNFTWSFNPDGSYDISIDLITLGDVIESLKVNIAAKEEFKEVLNPNSNNNLPVSGITEDSKIFRASNLNILGYSLYEKVKNFTENLDYIYIPPKDEKTNNQYYIRLYELLYQLENLTFPQITNNDGSSYFSPLEFEKFGCKVSYFPNQISLDPRICIFKPLLNSYGDIKNINIPSYLDKKILAPYAFSNDNDNYGLLMNLYLNFEFISELLLSNGDSNQTLSLFKFLQGLCSGINNALGGVNKLEPIIKDDNVITIIDQTYQILENEGEQVTLEVFGYNKNKTSNFVKDIKFVSKISPQLASMISIGATAAGSSTSEIDGTAFSKWSEGLQDRFSLQVLEPKGIKLEEEQIKQQKEKTKKEYEEKFINFPLYDRSIKNLAKEVIDSTLSTLANIQYNVSSFFGFNPLAFNSDALAEKAYYKKQDNDLGEIRIVNDPFNEEINNKPMKFDEYYSQSIELERRKKEKNRYKFEDINKLTSTNYAVYLLNAFGGISDIEVEYLGSTSDSRSGISLKNQKATVTNLKVDENGSRYREFNDTFISQGKGVYQNYINTLNNSRYTSTNVPSSEIGFIPLSFELTLDGISGIKIYNKLNINSEFLPSNYPESLNFIITKVNHSISNNSWDTSLSTISVPKTKPYKFESSPLQTSGGVELNIIGPQPDNNRELIITSRNNRQIRYTIENITSQLDPKARPAFEKFFNTLKEKYRGYTIVINEIRRTWEESFELKNNPLNPSYSSENADVGRSPHNYGLALDINIETPITKRTMLKGDRKPWIEEEINKVAIDSGLRWGGDFKNYVDCVHFDYYVNIDSAYQNIISQARVLDPTITIPFRGPKGKENAKKIDKFIKEGKIKLKI
jgi:hypothetical protein